MRVKICQSYKTAIHRKALSGFLYFISAGRPGYYTGHELKEQLKAHGSKATAYLIDEDGRVGKSYNAKTTPDMFVIDKCGMMVYAGAIDNKPTTDLADVPTARNYVRAALDEAMSGKRIASQFL